MTDKVLAFVFLATVNAASASEGPALAALRAAAAGDLEKVYSNTRTASAPAAVAAELATVAPSSPTPAATRKSNKAVRAALVDHEVETIWLSGTLLVAVFAALGGWGGVVLALALAPATPVAAALIGGYIGAVAGGAFFNATFKDQK